MLWSSIIGGFGTSVEDVSQLLELGKRFSTTLHSSLIRPSMLQTLFTWTTLLLHQDAHLFMALRLTRSRLVFFNMPQMTCCLQPPTRFISARFITTLIAFLSVPNRLPDLAYHFHGTHALMTLFPINNSDLWQIVCRYLKRRQINLRSSIAEHLSWSRWPTPVFDIGRMFLFRM